jgi:transcriptional regulator with XRE-family HTH domain
MTFGQVLQKERSRARFSPAEMAERVRLANEQYEKLESGEPEIEEWAPLLGRMAMEFEIPTSRLISSTGRSEHAEGCGRLIRRRREQLGTSVSHVAERLQISLDRYQSIEAETSPLESLGPALLRFSEATTVPIFNFFYPCGLPSALIDDYP